MQLVGRIKFLGIATGSVDQHTVLLQVEGRNTGKERQKFLVRVPWISTHILPRSENESGFFNPLVAGFFLSQRREIHKFFVAFVSFNVERQGNTHPLGPLTQCWERKPPSKPFSFDCALP